LRQAYPVGLEPDHEESLLVNGNSFEIASVNITFKKWRGAAPQYTFGGKPIIDYNGKPMFAELAILEEATKGGWSARWVETYGTHGRVPYYFTSWLDAHLKQQIVKPLNDPKIEHLLANISVANGDSYDGCWDVLARSTEKVLFIESKHRGRDRIRDTQIKWLSSAIRLGLSKDNFLIAEWKFEDELR
jgi:hypothetical protein